MNPVDEFGASILRRLADAIDPSGEWFDTVQGHVVEDQHRRVEFLHARFEGDLWTVRLHLTVTRQAEAGPPPALPELTPGIRALFPSWRRTADPGFELASHLAILIDPSACFAIESWGDRRWGRDVEMFAWTLELPKRTVRLMMEFHDELGALVDDDVYAG